MNLAVNETDPSPWGMAVPLIRATFVVWLLATSTAYGAGPAMDAVVAFPHLRFIRPVLITHAPDGSNRLFVVEQSGRVLGFENDPDVRQADVMADIRSKVRRQGEEEGLLGLAFHPRFKTSRAVFLHYTAANGGRRNVLSRFVADAAGHTIDPTSERVILEVDQPWSNHNGGMIAFGHDGYLYVALGDGGAGGDPMGHGQNKTTLLGAILRLDVDHQDPPLAYAVPSDNPFTGQSEARGEIWAYGLRNVWRFSFDRATGELWAGDVGQDRWEEIDLITRGGNYGWSVREGQHAFGRHGAAGPFEAPIVEHPRGEARSITGGYVYRGRRLPALRGAYVYGDFVTGLIWCLRYNGQRVTEHHYLARVPAISSFGEDRDGELYITSLDGQVYKLVPK